MIASGPKAVGDNLDDPEVIMVGTLEKAREDANNARVELAELIKA